MSTSFMCKCVEFVIRRSSQCYNMPNNHGDKDATFDVLPSLKPSVSQIKSSQYKKLSTLKLSLQTYNAVLTYIRINSTLKRKHHIVIIIVALQKITTLNSTPLKQMLSGVEFS